MKIPIIDVKLLKKVMAILFVGVICVLFFEFIEKLNFYSILQSVKKVSVSTVLLSGISIFISTVMMQSLYFWLYFEGSRSMLPNLLPIFYSTAQIQFYSLVLPPGGTALLRIFKFQKLGYTAESVISVVILYRLACLFIYLMIGLCFIIYRANGTMAISISFTSFQQISLIVLIFLLLIIFTYYFFCTKKRLYNRFIEYFNIVKRILLKFPVKLQIGFISILFSNLFGAFAYTFIFISLDLDIPLLDVYLLRGFVMMVQALPVSFIGIGLREVSLGAILPIYGLSNEQTVVAILLVLFLQIFLALVGAIFEVPSLKKYLV